MTKSYVLALFLAAATLSASTARSDQLLFEADRTDLPRVAEALSGDYTLYALLKEGCLLGADDSVTGILDREKIRFSIIAPHMRPGAYYLVTRSPAGGGADLELLTGALYREGDVLLIEALGEEAERISQMGFELVHLMPLHSGGKSGKVIGDPLLRKRSNDGLIGRLVREVSVDSLDSYVKTLEGFRTRYSYTDSCWSAGQWVYDKFESFGIDAMFHYYDWGAEHWRNVVGTIPGTSDSTVIVIVCGHFDSISEDPWNLAPGAEDNGSGTAVVIEAARVLSQEEHDYTLRFIAFSGEEEGLIGSYYYVTEAYGRGDNIVAAMNFDMVGYTDDEHYDISVRYDSNSVWLGNLITAASRFSGAEPYSFEYSSPSSDHWYFQQYGYPATFSIHISRTHGYQFYHSVYDTAGNLNYRFLAEVTRMAAASMAMIGNEYRLPPLPPEYVEATDAGLGGALQVAWSPSVSPGILGYNVYYGLSPRKYEGSVYAGDTTQLVMHGLENDTTYFVSVSAIDDYAEGGYSVETSAVPREIPAPPESLRLMPIYLGMDLFWKPNSELDLAGYNLYRSTVSGGPYGLVNSGLVTDTVYCDSGLAPGEEHYYVITAVDTTDLESDYSGEESSFPLSFDQGILLVDETKNGAAGTLLPDSVQDQFYARVLRGYEFDSWDFDSSGYPTISAMGLHSTVIWRSEDIYEHHIRSRLEDLSYYLRHGGNLWLIGWKAVGGVMSSGDYPYTFVAGDWPYDYLHLIGSDNTGTVGLVRAEGEGGYPGALVDSAKAPSGWNGSIYLIDTAIPSDGEVLLRFYSDGTDTTFDGEPIATRYIGADYRVIFFGFPLYYLKDADAQVLVDAVLSDLGESTGMAEQFLPAGRSLKTVLFQNSPNPFRKSTRIRANVGTVLPAESITSVLIYDAAGRLIRTLPLEKGTGGRYDGEWFGETDGGQQVPSGTYFYRLSVDDSHRTRKLILIR